MTDADSIMTSRMATIAIVVGVAASVLVATRTIAPTSSPSSAVLFQVLGLGINVITVSIPGRFDSDVEATSNMAFPWPTLLAPAGYAFAIWGVIYVGEVMGLLVLLFGHKQVAEVAQRSSRAWLCANIAQSFWCAAFRPWALSRLWLSSICLGATALCLFYSQCELSLDRDKVMAPGFSAGEWALLQWPRSLHLGWTTAATLVNLNAWVGKSAAGAPAAMCAAVLSLLLAARLSELFTSAAIRLPAAALSVNWALFAIAKGAPVGRDAEALGQPALEGLASSATAIAMGGLAFLSLRAGGLL